MPSSSPSITATGASALLLNRQQRIAEAVTRELNPSHLEVINESHNHGGAGTETHYKVVAVSAALEGQRALVRHQRIYAVTEAERNAGLHALALHLYTPSEWAAIDVAPASPACRGGSQ